MAKINKEIVIKLVLATAYAELGTKEDPPFSNLVKYNKWYYNRNIPAQWCATSASWVITKATGFPLRFENVPFWMDYHRKYKTFIDKNKTPQIGDICFMAFKEENQKKLIGEHVGIVAEVYSNGTIKTYEGNTSKTGAGSQSNGGEYCEKIRTKQEIVGFGRHNFVYMWEHGKGKEAKKV